MRAGGQPVHGTVELRVALVKDPNALLDGLRQLPSQIAAAAAAAHAARSTVSPRSATAPVVPATFDEDGCDADYEQGDRRTTDD